jgi:hypothetical protein
MCSLLDAVNRAKTLMDSVYSQSEAIDVAQMEYDLDEFQIEDLIVILKRRIAREG